MARDRCTSTVAQATVKFLSRAVHASPTASSSKLFAGCFGIFGHGNVAGLGQALLQAELDEPGALPYVLGRNEQAMVHTAVAYARMKDRLQTYAVSTSVGPGATNMVTGAALATINRLPVLLLPADTFADRARVAAAAGARAARTPATSPSTTRSVRCRKYFDRIWRPEQLPAALLGGDAGAHRPGRDRRGHPLLPAGRAGARRTTGRSSCSPSGSGTSPGRCPSRGVWPGRRR